MPRSRSRANRLPPGIKPCATMCPSCPFRPENAATGIAAAVVERMVRGNAGHQLCHSTPGGKPGERPGAKTRLCRGARDEMLAFFHVNGVLDAPTDEAWEEAAAKLTEA